MDREDDIQVLRVIEQIAINWWNDNKEWSIMQKEDIRRAIQNAIDKS